MEPNSEKRQTIWSLGIENELDSDDEENDLLQLD